MHQFRLWPNPCYPISTLHSWKPIKYAIQRWERVDDSDEDLDLNQTLRQDHRNFLFPLRSCLKTEIIYISEWSSALIKFSTIIRWRRRSQMLSWWQELVLHLYEYVAYYTAQLFIVPIQTVVSDYHLIKDKEKETYTIKKIHCVKGKDNMPFFMRSHPSLRNPLTFFRNFARYREFKIDILKKTL